jgi:hypothetical protein
MAINCSTCSNEFDNLEQIIKVCDRRGCPYAPKLVPKKEDTGMTTITIPPPVLPPKEEKGQLKLDLFNSG